MLRFGKLFLCCLVGSLLQTAGAETLTVPGSHATIQDALAAADPGDVIELTDNSTTYTGNLYITVNNLTIQGQAGLDPAPLIQGLSATHPLAGQGPQKWYYTGGASTSLTIFDTHGAAVVNASEGLTLRNLRLKADPAQAKPGVTAGVLDFRHGTNGVVENCSVDGAGPGTIGAERLVLTSNGHTFTNVTFRNGLLALEHHAGTGTLAITNCDIIGQQHVMFFNGGTAVVTSTTLDSSSVTGAANYGCVIGNEYGPTDLTFTRCVFRKSSGGGVNNSFAQLRHVDRGSGAGADDYNTGRYSPGQLDIRYDQCDFIGGPSNQINRVVFLSNGRVGWIVRTLRYTGCNFYNVHGTTFAVTDFPYPGNDYKGPGTVDRFEDYNVFKRCQNVAPSVGLVSGGHSITLNGDQPLYVDAPGADFRLAANSPAATLRAPASPAYTGALGVSGSVVVEDKLTVGHTGAEYTSVNAALAAATQGSLIEIVDNSLPYQEDITLSSQNSITIQGAPGLTPRPVIQAPATTETVVKLMGSARNITLRNLELDGTLMTTISACVLDMRDAGETLVENCVIKGAALGGIPIYSERVRIMRDCNVTCAADRPAIQQNLTLNFAILNCEVRSAAGALKAEGGMFIVEDSYLQGDSGSTINFGFPGRTSIVDLRDSVITSNAGGPPAVGNNLIYVANVNGRRMLMIDNCDLAGSLQGSGTSSPSGTGILVAGTSSGTNNAITYMKVTDSIFFNTAVYAIYFEGNNTGSVTIPGLVFDPLLGVENYNAYKLSPNVLSTQGIIEGPANRELAAGDDLYVNPPTDLRLLATSQAATLNSTGMPVYAGSQGVAGNSVIGDWAVYN